MAMITMYNKKSPDYLLIRGIFYYKKQAIIPSKLQPMPK